MKPTKKMAFSALAALLLFSTFFSCKEDEEDLSLVVYITPETGSKDTEFHFSLGASGDCRGELFWRIVDENQNSIALGDDENDASFSRKFEAVGNYTARANSGSCFGSKTFRVVEDLGEFPVAVMKVTPPEGDPSTIFEFDASQSHDGQTPTADLLVRWDWTSDGTWDINYSTDKTVSKIFNSPGNYKVSLQVKDADNNESDIVDKIIKVNYVTGAPQADFRINPEYGTTVTDFKFNASNSYDVITATADLLFSWDFENDGIWEYELSHFMIIEHRYTKEGEFEVKLLVQDEDGLTDHKLDTVLVINCINGGDPCEGTPTVNYEGKTYTTVQISYQCWLRENLNVGTMIQNTVTPTNNHVIEKYCYDNDESFCDTYGGLYHWDEMMDYTTNPGSSGICPDGWRIPTGDDWDELADILGGPEMAGQQMKSCTQDWLISPNHINTNESGFTGLPGGTRHFNTAFYSIGTGSLYWTSNEHPTYIDQAVHRGLSYQWDELTGYGNSAREYKRNGESVRCIKNPR